MDKVLVVDMLKYLHENKLNSIFDGNISWKKCNDKGFNITPSSVRKCDLTIDDIVYVDENMVQHNGVASREMMFHKMIIEDRYNDDIHIVHCHPPNTVAYVGLNQYKELETLKELFPELNIKIGPNVPFLSAGSSELAKSVAQNVRNCDIVVLENHGVVAVGTSLVKAVDIIETVEFYAHIANVAKH
jgi:L-fuculose-phosphate aldolase